MSTKFKKELERLKRENGRLQKMLDRYEENEAESEEAHPEIQEYQDRMTNKESKRPCQKCRGKTQEVSLGKYTYLFCEDCKHRQKMK